MRTMALFATAALPASASMGIISADLRSAPLYRPYRRQYKYKIFKVKMQKNCPESLDSRQFEKLF